MAPKIHSAQREDIADLVTRRALPTEALPHLDPFLFLNHHGPQVYPPKNRGLPFSAHPHRGFETVTFILSGELVHKDTGGHESAIRAGGVQWMTAGRGLEHSELSSEDFKNRGGRLEILQLWVNLPARLKMTAPRYVGLQREQIPALHAAEGVEMDLISGRWRAAEGPIHPLTDIRLLLLRLKKNIAFEMEAAAGRTIFFYLVSGSATVNEKPIEAFQLAEFTQLGEKIHVAAHSDSVVLWGDAPPNNEPIVAHGPFVMNSPEEIRQAIRDYQSGKFR